MSDPFIGEIRIFAGTFAPVGWSYCDGSVLPISEYDALFTLIGTTYGGDGQQTFALPDLRGRLPLHQGTGPGLTPRQIGAAFGEEQVTLTSQTLASHTHAVGATASPGTSPTPGAGVFAGVSTGAAYAAAAGSVAMNGQVVSTVGGGSAHDNLMPSLVINYIIALEGIWPSQN